VEWTEQDMEHDNNDDDVVISLKRLNFELKLMMFSVSIWQKMPSTHRAETDDVLRKHLAKNAKYTSKTKLKRLNFILSSQMR
jgi:hypothetical protein